MAVRPKRTAFVAVPAMGWGGPVPYGPSDGSVVGSLDLGGSPAADARAREDEWPKLLAFLSRVPA